jgi:hypothetical protein
MFAFCCVIQEVQQQHQNKDTATTLSRPHDEGAQGHVMLALGTAEATIMVGMHAMQCLAM